MTQAVDNDLEKLKYRLNLILIALLCSTTLAPCVLFFVRGPGELIWMLVFIAISYLVSQFPKRFYDRLQISTDLSFYKKLGVDKFKRLSTNGDFINRRIRKKFPTHRNVANLEMIKEKLNETYTIEKSHTVLFVFCLLTTSYAFWTNSMITAIILLIGNTIFNFYPNLLQQYNRIRYTRVLNNYARQNNN
ncbi:MAG: hypothetical protein DYG99_16200 [Bacteroidetes bacterium CHB5]|nr:hypothetical protein [Bacteroidetes bacterium CHB5]